MIKLTFLILWAALLAINPTRLLSQPQWKFHIAFEDAMGAKDTIWLIWDTTATLGWAPFTSVDTALGEGPVNFDYSKFNVWIYNSLGDSTKTSALPYTAYPTNNAIVEAFNYQLPIFISWDTSLFHINYLPFSMGEVDVGRIDNDYFFLVNNSPVNHYFDMLVDDKVLAPYFNWGSYSQFPMSFVLTQDNVGISNTPKSNNYFIENPVKNNLLAIHTDDIISTINIYSTNGEKTLSSSFVNISYSGIAYVNLSSLKSGLYIIEIFNKQNQIYYDKIIKTP